MNERVRWLDHAKAMSITLVVMMHSVLGVGIAMGGEGFMHALVEFSNPFRIPTFFLLAGLLVERAAAKPWLFFLDRKVAFYAYFYVLWVTIQFAFKTPLSLSDYNIIHVAREYILAFVNPDTTLWFIAVLPVYFVIAKLTQHFPKYAILGATFVLLAAPIDTGWTLVDSGSNGLFYFLVGQHFAQSIFKAAQNISQKTFLLVCLVALWVVLNTFMVRLVDRPGIDIALALVGAAGLICTSLLLDKVPAMSWLRWVGQNTLVIYLAFFLPMAISRIALVKIGVIADVGMVSFIVWLIAMTGPVIAYFMVQRIGLGIFLFQRPNWAALSGSK